MLPEGDELPDKIIYQAASPDEAALVTAAKHFGFFFFRFVRSLCILSADTFFFKQLCFEISILHLQAQSYVNQSAGIKY